MTTEPTQMQKCQPTIVVCETAAEASGKVAGMIADVIRSKPHPVLGLATGGTPVQTYAELVRMHREEGLDFSETSTFNLDEYIGLAPEHHQSYRQFMQGQLFDHVNIDVSRTLVPDGLASDPLAHAVEYEGLISAAGGIDLQLLGIGHNGHIAFNEPGSPIDCRTRVVDLAQQTIDKNARFFESADDVPRSAITMGIGTILEAKRIVLLACGEGKAEAIYRTIEQPPTEDHPASLLQHHGAVTIVVDGPAAAKLALN